MSYSSSPESKYTFKTSKDFSDEISRLEEEGNRLLAVTDRLGGIYILKNFQK